MKQIRHWSFTRMLYWPPIPLQGFKPVGGRQSQIRKCLGVVQHPKLPTRSALSVPRQAARHFATPDAFGLCIQEVIDHDTAATITRSVIALLRRLGNSTMSRELEAGTAIFSTAPFRLEAGKGDISKLR